MNRTAAMICWGDRHRHVFMCCNFNGGEMYVSTWTTLQRGEGKGREIKREALVSAAFSDRLEFKHTYTHHQRLSLLTSKWVMCCKVMWMGWISASLVVHTIQHPPLLWKCIGSDSGTNQQGRGSRMLHSRTSQQQVTKWNRTLPWVNFLYISLGLNIVVNIWDNVRV